MKKWMIVVLAGVMVFGIIYYLAVPTNLPLKESLLISTTRSALFRLMIEKNEWDKWWPGSEHPGDKKTSDQSFTYHDNSYVITLKNFNSIEIAILHEQDTLAKTSLVFIEEAPGSIKMQWEGILRKPQDMVSRLLPYKIKKDLEKDLSKLLKKMQDFMEDDQNVYGIAIRQERVKDTALISTFDTCRGYPTVPFIYTMVNRLKQYSSSWAALITGYPMLNIYTRDSLLYQVKVALPLNKKLPPKDNIAYKWMLPGGYIMVTEVQGSPSKIEQAFQQLELYVKDHKLVAPAIPFYSLVTDRFLEKDSSRWITRIYYPVMD